LAVSAAVICHYAIEQPFLALRFQHGKDQQLDVRSRLCVE
jgi:hypothetical protein